MLLTVDRLPIPNKTMVHESRFFTIVERWLSAADQPQDNVFIDEATGMELLLLSVTLFIGIQWFKKGTHKTFFFN